MSVSDREIDMACAAYIACLGSLFGGYVDRQVFRKNMTAALEAAERVRPQTITAGFNSEHRLNVLEFKVKRIENIFSDDFFKAKEIK